MGVFGANNISKRTKLSRVVCRDTDRLLIFRATTTEPREHHADDEDGRGGRALVGGSGRGRRGGERGGVAEADVALAGEEPVRGGDEAVVGGSDDQVDPQRRQGNNCGPRSVADMPVAIADSFGRPKLVGVNTGVLSSPELPSVLPSPTSTATPCFSSWKGIDGKDYAASFPSISESFRHRSKGKAVRVPINTMQKKFDQIAADSAFPFEQIEQNKVKIKAILIILQWSNNGAVAAESPETVTKEGDVNCHCKRGPTTQRPWFRLPPKVKIIPGILGPAPIEKPRVEYPSGGEREVRGDWEYDDRLQPFPYPPTTHLFKQSGDSSTNPNPPSQSPLAVAAPPKSNLAKFVGHLWRGSPTRSFVEAVKAVPAATVVVKMNQGGGRQDNYGWGRGAGGG